jgi:hypothetical protein
LLYESAATVCITGGAAVLVTDELAGVAGMTVAGVLGRAQASLTSECQVQTLNIQAESLGKNDTLTIVCLKGGTALTMPTAKRVMRKVLLWSCRSSSRKENAF